jgi:hypothetical protein
MSWHPAALPGAGWLVIAGLGLLAVVGMHPSARMAERFLQREGIVVGDLPASVEAEEPVPSLIGDPAGPVT